MNSELKKMNIHTPHQFLIYEKTKEKNRRDIISNVVIQELEFLEYPKHKTAVYILSNVPDPDCVVIYTYGGTMPHMFERNADGEIVENSKVQFTWEWMRYWLGQGVAMVIFDMPDYFKASMHVTSFYRTSNDRLRESIEVVKRVKDRFPDSKIVWHGLSYGTNEAAKISQVDCGLDSVILSSAPWHVAADFDEYHQGARLDWYDVSTSKVPVLIVQHQLEKFEKAIEEMNKTDSITVTNTVTQDDGHFFRRRQSTVVKHICDWARGHPIPKEIP